MMNMSREAAGIEVVLQLFLHIPQFAPQKSSCLGPFQVLPHATVDVFQYLLQCSCAETCDMSQLSHFLLGALDALVG